MARTRPSYPWMQSLGAVPVPAVVGILVFVVVLGIAELFVEFCFKAVFHELGYYLFEKLLNILHTPDVGNLKQFTYPFLLLFSSGVRFLLVICTPPFVLDIFYDFFEVYTESGIISKFYCIASLNFYTSTQLSRNMSSIIVCHT